jgi:dTDP-4-dehydrorhamnose 3,5-epimerase
MPTSAIPGVEVSQRRTFPDDRGNFLELMRSSEYPVDFVQVNHSFSRAGVVRGLHYHRKQHDLWYVVRGRARIGLADLRGSAPLVETFELDQHAATTLLIPPGVAHGYLALDDLDLIYLVTRTYDPDDEHGIAWNDPTLAIDWQVDDAVVSRRDAENPPLTWPISLTSS